jgi:hypothetical protein
LAIFTAIRRASSRESSLVKRDAPLTWLGRKTEEIQEMAETAAYPYATHLDIKFDPLTLDRRFFAGEDGHGSMVQSDPVQGE